MDKSAKNDAVTRLSPGREGSTDHVSFDAVGIPAFEFIQGSIDYENPYAPYKYG